MQFYDGGIMFMGSFPFGGMLGSCRREGMCMLTLISEKGKLIMLIKQAMQKHYTIKWAHTFCEGDRSSSNAISVPDV